MPKQQANNNVEEYCYSTNSKNSRNSIPDRGGNWQRLKYDLGTFGKDVQQASAPLERTLDPHFVHRQNPCRASDIGYISKFGVSYDTNNPLVDTESELFNLTRPATKDPNYKYNPLCSKQQQCLEGYPCGGGIVCEETRDMFHFPTCAMKQEFSQISNPTCTLRETGVNRVQPTYLDH